MSLTHQVLRGCSNAAGRGGRGVLGRRRDGHPHATPYAVTKAGLSLFAADLRRELRRTPVTVLLTVLGEVDTDMLIDARADPVMSEIAKRVGSSRHSSPHRSPPPWLTRFAGDSRPS